MFLVQASVVTIVCSVGFDSEPGRGYSASRGRSACDKLLAKICEAPHPNAPTNVLEEEVGGNPKNDILYEWAAVMNSFKQSSAHGIKV